MRSSIARYAAFGVLALGAGLIVWTAVSQTSSNEIQGSAQAQEQPEPNGAAITPTRTESAALAESELGNAPAEAAAPTTTSAPALDPIPVLGTAPTLNRLDGWLNTEAASLEEIRAQNKITVVQFWTFGCRNCKNTLDALSNLYADFRERGVEVVGVHSPEFAYEAEVDNIIEAAANLGVIWPIALDTTKHNFHAWQEGPTGYWPRVYVIDGANQIRFDRRGDSPSKYAELYEVVERLLAET